MSLVSSLMMVIAACPGNLFVLALVLAPTGTSISMPPPLQDGQVEYPDGTPATVSQVKWVGMEHSTSRYTAGRLAFP